ncbi:acyl-CoA dehydrogenase family protein [Arthrobacter rhombi]|uniref:acyl-CoA dehydrogenase family protein n=1 Tax=Arthrobacter rhombi TaxID=71253 RepID=UPI0031DE9E85
MEWKFSEEQEAYAEALQDWLAGAVDSERLRGWFESGDASGFTVPFVRDWAGVGTPEEEGGQGGGLVELALTAENLARVDAPSGDWLATVLALPALAGQPEIVEESLGGRPTVLLVPANRIPDGDTTVAAGPGGLQGAVPMVLAGDTATRFVVPVNGEFGIELHLVEADQPGVTRATRSLLDRSRSLADVTLAGAASERLNVDVVTVLDAISRRAAVLVAADTVGATQTMLDLSVGYSKQRQQFGVPIGSFQAVKHAAATMMVGVEAGRSAVYYTAASVDSDQPDAALHAAATKAQVTQEGPRAADSALTMHGAIGYTWEHDLHLYYKRAKLNSGLFGSPGAWNERLADALDLVASTDIVNSTPLATVGGE